MIFAFSGFLGGIPSPSFPKLFFPRGFLFQVLLRFSCGLGGRELCTTTTHLSVFLFKTCMSIAINCRD